MVKDMDAITLNDWMESGRDFYLFDARDKNDYKVDHLPGARSLLLSDISDDSIGNYSKEKPVVVYSNDKDCPASGLVSKKLDESGFEKVYDYNPSYKDWVEKGYPLES